MWKATEEQGVGRESGAGVAHGVANMKDDLNVLAQDAKDTARASLVEVKNSAGRAVDAVKQRGVRVADAAGSTVSDHPFKSLGIAFGVGVLVGALMFTPRD